MDLFKLAVPLLAMQFVAFGWRINREIAVGDQGRRTWFPLSDILNILSMWAVTVFCLVRPILQGREPNRLILAGAFVLITFHPVALAAHYRLFTEKGRHVYVERNEDFPYATGPEIAIVLLAVASVGLLWLISAR